MSEAGGEGATDSRLATWRKRRGLTQEDVVRSTGISRSTYRRLEQGDYENPLFDPSWSGGLNVRFVCARDAHEAEALLGALPPGVVVV